MQWKFTKEVQDQFARFSPDAFAGQIGKEIPFTVEGFEGESTGKILDVVVHEQGCCAEFLIEIPEDSPLAAFIKENPNGV